MLHSFAVWEEGCHLTLTREQFEREGSYRLAIQVMKTLRQKGLLNESEFRKARQRLIEKYKPVWGHYPEVTGIS